MGAYAETVRMRMERRVQMPKIVKEWDTFPTSSSQNHVNEPGDSPRATDFTL